MASILSSFFSTTENPDVFGCFRAEDTGNNFAGHLDAALRRERIAAVMDFKLPEGLELSPARLEAIEKSKVALVILSQNFADSPRCLNELEKILECKDKFDKKLVPVYYHLNPDDLREPKETIKDALDKHQPQFGTDKVDYWRFALKKVANLRGWYLHGTSSETEVIKQVVEDILEKLSGVVTPIGAEHGAKLPAQGIQNGNNSSCSSNNNNNNGGGSNNNNNNNNNSGGGNNNNNNNNNGGCSNNNNNNNNNGGCNNNNNNNNNNGGCNNNNNNNNGGCNNNNNNNNNNGGSSNNNNNNNNNNN